MSPDPRAGTVPRVRTITLLAIAATLALSGVPGSEAGGQTSTPPNVLLILVDDMRWDEAGLPTALNETFPSGYLPTITGLASNGFWASNAFVVNSLCCPSRASVLTGNYSHTNGVWNNQNIAGRGGFKAFQPNEGSTLATWFQGAGYRTGLVGKYFNGYGNVGYVAAGWDRWVAFRQKGIGYYNYTLSVDGTGRSFGSSSADYSTDVLAGYAADFVSSTPASEPLFLMFTPYSPHSPFTPAPRHAGMYTTYKPKMPPNLAEADVSDKPAWVRALAQKGAGWAGTKRKQMEMLMSVDDAIARIMGALETTGRLDNTVVLFISDNGLSGGSHRWTTKKSPWDEALRTPFIVRGPGIAPGSTSDQLVLNIDVADTLAELVGLSIPATDGSSLVPLLQGGTDPIHDIFGFERLVDTTNPPSYCGVRTLQHKYVRYSTGEEELYDLVADPWELQSRHADPALAALKADVLAATRQLCSPPPPGYSF